MEDASIFYKALCSTYGVRKCVHPVSSNTHKTTSVNELSFTVTGINFEEYLVTRESTMPSAADTLSSVQGALLEHRTENKIICLLCSGTEKRFLCNLAKFP